MAWNTSIFCGLFLLITVVTVHGSLPAQITKAIDTATVSAGQEGKLNCSVAGREGSGAAILWSKMQEGGQSTVISRNELITRKNPTDSKGFEKFKVTVSYLSNSLEVYTLHVRRVSSSDSGLYECKIYMQGLSDIDEFPRAVGQLVVQLPPSMSGSDTSSFVRVVQGEDAKLTCDASGEPKPVISWSRANGSPLPGGLQTIYGTELVIPQADTGSSGVYRCKADNNVRPPATIDITLQVNTKPVAKPFRKSYGQAPDKNFEVELACIISGDPTPDVMWYKNNGVTLKRVNDDYKHEVNKIAVYPGHNWKDGDLWLTLRIMQLQQNDYGNYTCMGTNIYGSGSAIVTVFYTPTCQGSSCDFESYGGSSSAASVVATQLFTITMATLATIWRSL